MSSLLFTGKDKSLSILLGEMKQFWVKCYHCWREGNIVVVLLRKINYYHVIQNPQNLIKMFIRINKSC